MALSGTLKDFGIADILQLIGHQTKTGTLVLKSGAEQVEVLFVEGNVVFASQKARKQANLLGAMLLRAELVTPEKLADALTDQQRSLKRLGDILVEQKVVTEQQLAQMTRLQTTETLYQLFRWKTGTYEFTQGDIDPGRSGFEPIRAESILLEGFRRMDEWPAVRKKIPDSGTTFEKQKELDTRDLPDIDDGGLGLGGSAADGEGKPTDLHKLVCRLALEGRTAEKIGDVSRLGEFEALKALIDLCDWGYLRPVAPARGTAAAVKGLAAGGRRLARSGALGRLGLSLAFFLATLFLVHRFAPALGASSVEGATSRGALFRVLSRDQLLRLESALELYRAEHGEYPQKLENLVEHELLSEADLRYPFREQYYYRRTQQGFVLLPPLD